MDERARQYIARRSLIIRLWSAKMISGEEYAKLIAMLDIEYKDVLKAKET